MHDVIDSIPLEESVGPGLESLPLRPKGLFILDPESADLIYGPFERLELERLCEIQGPVQSRTEIWENLELLREAQVMFSGWGAPVMDASFLEQAPNLRAVFYGAGSVRPFVSEAFWDRDIIITSAYAANAQPVVEYTLSTIFLSLKYFWSYAEKTRRGLGWGLHTRQVPGGYQSTVGLVSLGMIARQLLERLSTFDVNILVYCPFLTAEEASHLNVTRCSLEELFQRSDVVSIHTPVLPETEGLVTGALLSSMKEGATLINTARGAIIRQSEMVKVLRARPDLYAILDVCEPEPPAAYDEILQLPNIILTPHIAGSLGPECRRLGAYMLDEFKRYLAGQPLRWRLDRERIQHMA